LKLKNDDD